MTKNLFDLQRLEKAAKIFKFPAPDDKEVTITCHYPTSHEIAAALCVAKADLQKAQSLAEQESQGVDAMEQSARLGAAMEQVACYCIDSCSAFPIRKKKDDLGIRRIDEETEELLSPVLGRIGSELFNNSKPSDSEKEG